MTELIIWFFGLLCGMALMLEIFARSLRKHIIALICDRIDDLILELKFTDPIHAENLEAAFDHWVRKQGGR